MGCIASIFRNDVNVSSKFLGEIQKSEYNSYKLYETTLHNESFDEKVLPENDIYVNTFIKEKENRKAYDIFETEEEKYGDLDLRNCCGLFSRDKDPLSDPRNQEPKKREGKLKGTWIDGIYVNTELTAIKEENNCCNCISFAQINREKIDNRDNAYALYLQDMEKKQKQEQKENKKEVRLDPGVPINTQAEERINSVRPSIKQSVPRKPTVLLRGPRKINAARIAPRATPEPTGPTEPTDYGHNTVSKRIPRGRENGRAVRPPRRGRATSPKNPTVKKNNRGPNAVRARPQEKHGRPR